MVEVRTTPQPKCPIRHTSALSWGSELIRGVANQLLSLRVGHPMGLQEDAIAAANAARKAMHQERKDVAQSDRTEASAMLTTWAESIGVEPNSMRVTSQNYTRGPYTYESYGGWVNQAYRAETRLTLMVDKHEFLVDIRHKIGPSFHYSSYTEDDKLPTISVSMEITLDRQGKKEFRPADTLAQLGEALMKEKRFRQKPR
jgi:hypothetical protein